jgi:putative Holliday junction resolvase
MARILAVDPGERRLGLAVSDPTGSIARPLTVLGHASRRRDAEAIVQTAVEQEAERIVVGLALDVEGNVGPQARRALRLIEALRALTSIPVETWDESGSTQAAAVGCPKGTSLDARAAAVILQEFLDAHQSG